MSQYLHITGYSTALYATWYVIEEFGILFDAGDGVSAALLGKAGKIKHVFISHADRDHLTGLFQLNQLNARDGFPKIYYPKDCGSFPHLERFSKQFDPWVAKTEWIPIEAGTEITIKKDVIVQAIRNGHVQGKGQQDKSLSFHLIQSKRKLKKEFLPLSSPEIQQLMQERGRDHLTKEVRTTLLSYSGDTPVEEWDRWKHSQILIHEATFLGGKEDARIKTHGNLHSTLEEVIEMVAASTVQQLILGHFSSRYNASEIDERIRSLCNTYAIQFPVYRILPGQIVWDVLNQAPVFPVPQ
ncbi:MAG: MBL fold metallo-hydrolase [Bacteroidota bacterium]